MARKKTAKRNSSSTATRRTGTKHPAAGAPKPARKAAPALNPAKRGLDLVNWAHGTTIALLADWPADKLTFQPSPHDNHALWTIGHLATTYQWLASLLDGTWAPLPDNYNAMFGMGSKPVPDAAAYPPMSEVRSHFDRAYERFVDLAARIRSADASKPTIGNSHGFCRDRADVLDKAAWHEGWHSGQLSSLRRALGLKSIM
ncbi:MAG: DinB family protein [Phycisphaeraceae bacterium]|nr:DinB family protein [Phycisphaeraceae bacterium]